jgi:hypothetical protein
LDLLCDKKSKRLAQRGGIVILQEQRGIGGQALFQAPEV